MYTFHLPKSSKLSQLPKPFYGLPDYEPKKKVHPKKNYFYYNAINFKTALQRVTYVPPKKNKRRAHKKNPANLLSFEKRQQIVFLHCFSLALKARIAYLADEYRYVKNDDTLAEIKNLVTQLSDLEGKYEFNTVTCNVIRLGFDSAYDRDVKMEMSKSPHYVARLFKTNRDVIYRVIRQYALTGDIRFSSEGGINLDEVGHDDVTPSSPEGSACHRPVERVRCRPADTEDAPLEGSSLSGLAHITAQSSVNESSTQPGELGGIYKRYVIAPDGDEPPIYYNPYKLTKEEQAKKKLLGWLKSRVLYSPFSPKHWGGIPTTICFIESLGMCELSELEEFFLAWSSVADKDELTDLQELSLGIPEY